jgi:hypothetical protein
VATSPHMHGNLMLLLHHASACASKLRESCAVALSPCELGLPMCAIQMLLVLNRKLLCVMAKAVRWDRVRQLPGVHRLCMLMQHVLREVWVDGKGR